MRQVSNANTLPFLVRPLLPLLALLMLVGRPDALDAREATRADAAEAPLRFDIREGRIHNAFYRQGPVAAHLLLPSGREPRLLVAFPAGNSGVGLWFEPTQAPAEWRLAGPLQGVARKDPQGRTLRGIEAEIEVDAPRLAIREAVLSSVRVLRDYQTLGARPKEVAVAPSVAPGRVRWARDRLDGAPGYALALDLVDGTARGGDGEPVVLAAPPGRPLRLRLTALTGEPPLTPLPHAQLLDGSARDDARSRNALAFLSYREKFLAGSWRFDTYFGRDTLMSLRLLLPALEPEAVEAGLGSVLARLDPDGEVAHEEDIGEFAVLRHLRENGTADDAPIYDYGMVDDDFMLAPVAAAWLLDTPEGRARAEAFLARRTETGERHGDALARNLLWLVQRAGPFAESPQVDRLVGLKSGKNVGQWRDSEDGLGGGRYPYDVNAVFVPAALDAAGRLHAQELLTPYLSPLQDRLLAEAPRLADAWQRHAPPLFAYDLDADTARREVAAYAASLHVDPDPALTALPPDRLRFNAIALYADGRPVPVLHSDDGFALLFLDPSADTLDRAVEAMLRPFPAGLMTGVGLLVANPAYAGADLERRFGPDAYHGTVVWAWQQAVLAAGLDRQLRRDDLPAATCERLQAARRTLWSAIEAAHDMRTSELWSWTFEDGRYEVQPFGQRQGDADESNAAQLWSTVFLALRPPE